VAEYRVSFQSFVNRRNLLNQKLDAKRYELDGVIERLNEADASVAEIGYLTGLLLERRDLLSELAALDDAFVDYLLTPRSQSREADGSVPA
jgi:hypothetical protein